MKKVFFLFVSLFLLSTAVPASALMLKTVTIQEKVDPGMQLVRMIEVKNDQDIPITLYPTVEGFTDMGDESGRPVFTSTDPDVNDLPNWIKFNNEYTVLKPGEAAHVPFIIEIPKTASPGGHYAVVFFSTTPPQAMEGSYVSLGARLGTLVILDVAGEVTQGSSLETFMLKDGWFYDSLPVSFITRIKNTGNVHFKPQGTIRIRNGLGLTSGLIPANGVTGNVIPNTIRRFEDVWVKNVDAMYAPGFWNGVRREWLNFGFGPYTGNLELKIGRDLDKVVTASVFFVVIPWRLSLLAILLILILAMIMRLYDRSLVKRAQKAMESVKPKRGRKKTVKKESPEL